MKVIGLTGGIATGKSTVAGMLAEHGAVVIDADQLSRDAVLPGTETLTQIVRLLGSQAMQADGTLDRTAVRQLVFADPQKRKQLEAILHPAIKALALQRLSEARQSGAEVAVYMAPLLIEAGATDRVDEIWVVTVRPDIQLKRLIARDACSRDQAMQMVAAQMPLAEKECYGVVVIDNSNGLDETRQQVAVAWQQRVAQ